ncbi:MAG TPA: gephyrin-like molybdotransferase Glp [Mycobacteriales bacterium]|nr:gephyrin-like molybdotransferase Glp [Mycobacteriales bacterium]
MKPFLDHLRDCRSLRVRATPVSMSIFDAVGLELAEPVHASAPYPAFVASAMDGYAVRVADLPGRLRVVGDVPAGSVPDVGVEPGTAVRIMTGSLVPVGAEAVVPVEEVSVDGDHVEVGVTTTVGRHIRGIGDDVAPGDLVLSAGEIVRTAQLAALVAHNAATVAVRPRPRVAVLSTGDELVPHGTQPGPAQLVDSNGPGLQAAAEAAGAEVVHRSHVSDDPGAFRDAIAGLPDVELIVTSGGVSMGAYDVVKAELADRGIRFENVAMQPGRPQGWGRLDGEVPMLGLPGNPVSALLSFELFGRAALGRERPVATALLADPIPRSPKGKLQLVRGRLRDGEVSLAGGHESHLVVGLARADCLVMVDEQVESLPAGATVRVISLI